MRRIGWSGALALAVAAMGCGGSSDDGGGSPGGAGSCTVDTATAAGSSIVMSGLKFVPSCAKVAVGTTVTFRNDDSDAHTVTTDAGQPEAFDSGTLAAGDTFAHTFASAETLHVHCNFHSFMHLTIFVQ